MVIPVEMSWYLPCSLEIRKDGLLLVCITVFLVHPCTEHVVGFRIVIVGRGQFELSQLLFIRLLISCIKLITWPTQTPVRLQCIFMVHTKCRLLYCQCILIQIQRSFEIFNIVQRFGLLEDECGHFNSSFIDVQWFHVGSMFLFFYACFSVVFRRSGYVSTGNRNVSWFMNLFLCDFVRRYLPSWLGIFVDRILYPRIFRIIRWWSTYMTSRSWGTGRRMEYMVRWYRNVGHLENGGTGSNHQSLLRFFVHWILLVIHPWVLPRFVSHQTTARSLVFRH